MYMIDVETGKEVFTPVNVTTFSEGENEINAEEDDEVNED